MVCFILRLLATGIAYATTVPISNAQQFSKLSTLSTQSIDEINRHLLPLPKEIRLDKAITIRSNEQVVIWIPVDAHPFVKQAADELVQAFQSNGIAKTVVKLLDVSKPLPQFSVVLDRDDLLKGKSVLPKHPQGYIIHPLADSVGLVLKGGEPIGTLYAAATLSQLIRCSEEGVLVPLARIRDWPDLQERGWREAPWHTRGWQLADWKRLIDWHAAHKLNQLTIYAFISGEKKKGFFYKTKLFPPEYDPVWDEIAMAQKDFLPEVIRYGRMKGVKMEISTNPYDWFWGFVDAFPGIEAVGSPSGQGKNRWLCFSKEEARRFLKSLFTEMIDYMKPDRLTVVLGESIMAFYCRCESCKDPQTYLLKEAQVTWEVFREIMKDRADPVELELQFPVSELWDDQQIKNYKMIPLLSQEMVMNLYHYGFGPEAMQRQITAPELQSAIKQGYRVVGYIGLIPSGGYGSGWPTSRVPYLRRFIGEFAKNGYLGVSGRHNGGMSLSGYDMNHAALAEFTWNSSGRNVQEVLMAWATTEGYEHPKEFGKVYALLGEAPDYFWWAIIHGRGASYWEKAFKELLKPQPSWTEQDHQRLIETFTPFQQQSEAIASALSLAERLGEGSLVSECRIYAQSMKMMEQIIRLSEFRLQKKALDDAEVQQTIAALKAAWRDLKTTFNTPLLGRSTVFRKGFTGTVPLVDWGGKYLHE